MTKILIKVDSYSGYKADERPLSITIGENTIKVTDLLDRWYGEDHEYFKLKAEDGCTYIIRRDLKLDEWELIMMEKGSK